MRILESNRLCELTRPKNLGPTWGQSMALLGPKPCASGGKGNGLNGTFGRGGGDRIYQGAESKGTLRNLL